MPSPLEIQWQLKGAGMILHKSLEGTVLIGLSALLQEHQEAVAGEVD